MLRLETEKHKSNLDKFYYLLCYKLLDTSQTVVQWFNGLKTDIMNVGSKQLNKLIVEYVKLDCDKDC